MIKYISSPPNEKGSKSEMICHAMPEENKIYILIENPVDPSSQWEHIYLDKTTAKRLAKDLRREISFLKD